LTAGAAALNPDFPQSPPWQLPQCPTVPSPQRQVRSSGTPGRGAHLTTAQGSPSVALAPPSRRHHSTGLRCGDHGLQELPITGAIAATAVTLPPIHRDPADRFIIATALRHGLAVVTAAATIGKYPGIRVIW
jgi:hypothetical protein